MWRPAVPRLLVAVEPRLLEGALALLLESHVQSHVVRLRDATAQDLEAQYEAAVVTLELPQWLRPDLVITLPPQGAGGTGWVTTHGACQAIEIASGEEVVALIARWFGRQGAPLWNPDREVTVGNRR
jgi:hypothetical protein